MRIAVTNHAVDRYAERVEGAKGFQKESIREQIRKLVEDGFELGIVKDHPLVKNRRVVPFKSGSSVLFLSIGPNTTDFEADIAVIGVLYEKEVTEGKVGMGLRLEDVFPELGKMAIEESKPGYVVFIGPVRTTIERYFVNSSHEVNEIIRTRAPNPDDVTIYSLIED